MSVNDDVLERFQDAILKNNASNAVADLKAKNRFSPQEQLNVYIEGYRIRLLEAIRSDYPALLELVGDEAFERLALSYIEHHPSASYNLDHYPHAFALFVKGKLQTVFVEEVAQLEGVIAEIFMAPESAPLTPSFMLQLTPESFATLMLQPRTALRLLAFSYPVNSWLSATRAGGVPEQPMPSPVYLCVVRHMNNVQRNEISEAEYLLLQALFSGITLETAVERTATAYPQHMQEIVQNVQQWFAQWLDKGFFRIDS